MTNKQNKSKKLLSANFQKRLDNANKILLRHGGKAITPEQAINFNSTHRPESGRQGGDEAIRDLGCIDGRNINDRQTMQIGDALIAISRKYSGVDIYP